jgi:pimeloyl-ACP methyl ester carboxylesterase
MTAAGVADQHLRLRDGRRIGYCIYGDPAGAPILFLHGTPGSRLKFAIGHEVSKSLGLAIIAPDRWGYGLTDAPAAISLPAFAADMAEFMQQLGHRRFAVGGISGGAPYAVAVAAHLEECITGLALVSPLGPVRDGQCTNALPAFVRFCFTVLPRMPAATAAVFTVFRWTLRWTPRFAGRLATLRAGRKDRELIARPGIAGPVLGSFLEGLRRGTAGPVIDVRLFSRPWDVDFARIAAPTRVWIGTRDSVVPVVAARALAERIKDCSCVELAGEGHLWVAEHYPRVLDWVASTVRTSMLAPSSR